MYKTKEEQQAYIAKLFSDINLFEWEVLHVSSDEDRMDVMQLLAKEIVWTSLKNEVNFLYINKYENFTLSSIKTALFKEIVSEWIGFATEDLYYPHEDALKAIKNKKNAQFVYAIINSYFSKYKTYIYEEIAQTFLRLLESMPQSKVKQDLIANILDSELTKISKAYVNYDFNHLKNKINNAHNAKYMYLKKLQTTVSNIIYRLEHEELDSKEKVRLMLLQEKTNFKIENFSKVGLDQFDPTLKMIKENIVTHLLETAL